MNLHRALVFAPLLLLGFAAVAPAQCSDPVPPRAGFQYKFEQDHLITFSDGYKTYANVLYPNATPGPCGWPLLILVHGLTGSRKSPSVEAVALVSQGFLVVAYDVRGQGDARTLNPNRGSFLWALDEWTDLAEVIEWAGAKYKQADSSRIGVFGGSQGGLHAWAAAAFSGKRLPPNARRSKPFPVVKAVVARFFSPEIVDVWVPEGTSFIYHLPAFAYAASQPYALLDPGFRNNLARYLDADDPIGLAAYLRSVPGKDFVTELTQSDVPVLAVLGWMDSWNDVNGLLDLFAKMRPATPKRVYLATGGHSTPNNIFTSVRHLFTTESWLKRYLKQGAAGPIEKGPPFLSALVPTDVTDYRSSTSLWRHRADSTFPPRDTVQRKFWLRKGGNLSAKAPDATEGTFTLNNVVKAGYGPRQFAADAAAYGTVIKSIPLDSHSYETVPVTQTLELLGKPVASFWVAPNHKNFLIGVRLFVVPSIGPEQILTTGALGVRQLVGPRPQRVDVDLGAVGAVIPIGSKLRLEVRNLDVQRPLAEDFFRRMPFYNTYQLVMHRASGSESWLQLDVRKMPGADIDTFSTTIDVTAPGQQAFKIRAMPEWKGGLYVVLLGFSGQGPPLVFPTGSELWLRPDIGTDVFLTIVNQPLLAGFAGLLDARGEGTCTLNFDLIKPLPLGLVGGYLQVAPTFLSSFGGFRAGAPYRLRFR